MPSSTWGLLCFIGILASGTLGTFPQFGSRNRKIHSISPLVPRVSPQVPPRAYRRLEKIKSKEQTSDGVSSAESFQEVQLGVHTSRGFQPQQQQQQGARPGAINHLRPDARRADSGGGLADVMWFKSGLTISIHLLWMRSITLFCRCVKFGELMLWLYHH